ncbi:MAG: MFS transporter [Solirubrobacterales bacterium]|nr:MFS transporter [Solirubrobacterales bacterium]MBV9683818.1 MFS transporter [Solirubrobacterales bacterium]MBV9809519.1 MFS transporter [Solirubrobacterales bacterium]
MVSQYRTVLSVPGAARLFATALLARLPQGMAPLAVLLLVRGATHSYAAAGLAVGASAFATAGCAPLLGRLVDRFGRRRVLAPLAITQSMMYALLVVAAETNAGAPTLVGLAALAGALLPPVAPVVRVLLREVFDDAAARETAYSLDAVTQEVIWITGPLVVALLIAVASPGLAVALLGAFCLTGATLFLRSRLLRSSEAAPTAAGERTSALASPELRALLGPIALTGTGLGAIEVGLPALALHSGSRPASGLLLALWSLGSMGGGLWYGSRTWRSSLTRRYRTLLVLAVLSTLPLVAARSIGAGLVCSLLAGVTIAPVFTCQYALVGRSVRAGSETEAFTWVSAALIGGLAAGSAIGGAVIAPAGVSAPFVISCLATLLAALLAVGFRVPARQPA